MVETRGSGLKNDKNFFHFQSGGGHLKKIVRIPDFAIRYVSRYLGHDAICIAILVYRINQCLDWLNNHQ